MRISGLFDNLEVVELGHECIDNGSLILKSLAEIINNHQSQSLKELLSDFSKLYEQIETIFGRCEATFEAILPDFNALFKNPERIVHNLNLYYPHIIQNILPIWDKVSYGEGYESGQTVANFLHFIFEEVHPSSPTRKDYRPQQTVPFEPERFYPEFSFALANSLFNRTFNQTFNQAFGKCMGQYTFFIYETIQEAKQNGNLIGTMLVKVPSFFETFKECLRSEKIDPIILENFYDIFMNNWKVFVRDAITYIFSGFVRHQAVFVKVLESIAEGNYSEAGNGVGRLTRPVFSRYFGLLSFKLNR